MRGKNINYKCHLLSASVSFCALFFSKDDITVYLV